MPLYMYNTMKVSDQHACVYLNLVRNASQVDLPMLWLIKTQSLFDIVYLLLAKWKVKLAEHQLFLAVKCKFMIDIWIGEALVFTLTLEKRIQSFASFWKFLECDSAEFIRITRCSDEVFFAVVWQ